MKRALITGITGQDGSYLAELLLDKGYAVHGIVRRCSLSNLGRISHLVDEGKVVLHEGDLTDTGSLQQVVAKVLPDEVYNLGAMSDVKISFDIPEMTANVDALGTLRLLEALRAHKKDARFYQASTSELYGKVQEVPQKETTPFYPRSPYGVAKLYAYWCVVNYREAYQMYACNGILFNHESPRRGENFVSRKITQGVAKIVSGQQKTLVLGNLDAKRDWGHARDFVEGMWRMLQQSAPQDFVLATGVTSTVRRFIELAFLEAGIEVCWEGKGLLEKGVDAKTGKILVEISPQFFRPAEVDLLIGDPSKAKSLLGWTPVSSLEMLVKEMVEADMGRLALI